jgi:fluoride exporter
MNIFVAICAFGGGICGVLVRLLCIRYQEICLLQFPLPLATLLVNIVGSFLAGLLFEKLACGGGGYAFFLIGLCGAMTTMSTCALESYLFIQRGSLGMGITNAFLNIALSIFFVACGHYFSKLTF